jgi:hypothetical protein
MCSHQHILPHFSNQVKRPKILTWIRSREQTEEEKEEEREVEDGTLGLHFPVPSRNLRRRAWLALFGATLLL